MKKLFLESAFDYDFVLFGIVSQEKAYRLAWLINNHCGYQLVREDDHTFWDEDGKVNASYTLFSYKDQINHLYFYLLENKDESNVLIPELRNLNYFMMVQGALEFFSPEQARNTFKDINEIQLVTEIDQHKLRSKQNLILNLKSKHEDA